MHVLLIIERQLTCQSPSLATMQMLTI